MVSISLSSKDMCIVSVMVRFKLVGLDTGGDVKAVTVLSSVGVLLESAELFLLVIILSVDLGSVALGGLGSSKWTC